VSACKRPWRISKKASRKGREGWKGEKRFEEKHETTKAQTRKTVPAGTRLEDLLLAPPAGKDYRLLKIVTRAATPDESTRLGNSRIPVTAEGG